MTGNEYITKHAATIVLPILVCAWLYACGHHQEVGVMFVALIIVYWSLYVDWTHWEDP